MANNINLSAALRLNLLTLQDNIDQSISTVHAAIAEIAEQARRLVLTAQSTNDTSERASLAAQYNTLRQQMDFHDARCKFRRHQPDREQSGQSDRQFQRGRQQLAHHQRDRFIDGRARRRTGVGQFFRWMCSLTLRWPKSNGRSSTCSAKTAR